MCGVDSKAIGERLSSVVRARAMPGQPPVPGAELKALGFVLLRLLGLIFSPLCSQSFLLE